MNRSSPGSASRSDSSTSNTHELRTPLAKALTYLKLALEDLPEAERALVKKAIDHLEDLDSKISQQKS